ncbi:MAG TPA: glycosyltransferase [Planctomycetota bacterium]|nr:glycosyltransferase [Planctomycetota bacterium]
MLTVSVEEFFHHGAFSRSLERKHWDRFESRLERNVEDALALLAEHSATATFFVHGSTAERQPELVRRILARGHEVASRGFEPLPIGAPRRAEFRDDLARTRAALERAGAGPIRGYRAPRWLRDGDEWILDVLADEGYAYDASVNPILRRFAGDRRFLRAHERRHGAAGAKLWEFPVSTASVCGLRVAISGGNWLRQLPQSFVRSAVERWDRVESAPLVWYFNSWELDADAPTLPTRSRLDRIRHYRNLDLTRQRLADHLARFRFGSIAQELALPPQVAPAPATAPIVLAPARPRPRPDGARPSSTLTLVVPIYRELQGLAYLRRTLLHVRDELAATTALRFVLVDDGSPDGTREALPQVFGGVPDCEIVLHDKNRGVAAAILTGIAHARTDLVATIDADCSYDPLLLREMLPLARDADVVTASPYHPQGRVQNVPRWRLFLSRTLSRIYDRLLHDKLYTYTSCFRIYRRKAVEGLELSDGGFPGMAEILIRMIRRGARVVEFPTLLESRVLGVSKMRTLRTIRGHLKLLKRLRSERGRAPSPKSTAADDVAARMRAPEPAVMR